MNLKEQFQAVYASLVHTWDAMYDGPIQVTCVSQPKWTIEAHVVIHPLKRTRDVMSDADRVTALNEVLRLLDGTHFKFLKGYEGYYETTYYIKPDWNYWRTQPRDNI